MDKSISCTLELSTSIKWAYSQAIQHTLPIIKAEHLVIAILKTGPNDVTQALKVMGTNPSAIAESIKPYTEPQDGEAISPKWHSRLRLPFHAATRSGKYSSDQRITTFHLIEPVIEYKSEFFSKVGLTNQLITEGVWKNYREGMTIEKETPSDRGLGIWWVCPTCQLEGRHDWNDEFSESVGSWHSELAPSCPDNFYEKLNPIGLCLKGPAHGSPELCKFPNKKYRSNKIVMCSKCNNEFFNTEDQENWSGREVVCGRCHGDGITK